MSIENQLMRVYSNYSSQSSSVCSLETYLEKKGLLNQHFYDIFFDYPGLNKVPVCVDEHLKMAKVLHSKKLEKCCILVSSDFENPEKRRLCQFVLLHEVFHVIEFLRPLSFYEKVLSYLGIEPRDVDLEEIEADAFAAKHSQITALSIGLQLRLDEKDKYSRKRTAVLYKELSERYHRIKPFCKTRNQFAELKKVEELLSKAEEKLLTTIQKVSNNASKKFFRFY